jgi:hypothetical protein
MLTLILTICAGGSAYSWVSDAVSPKPLYELTWPDIENSKVSRSEAASGWIDFEDPWLIVDTQEPGEPRKSKVEVRNLADGKLLRTWDGAYGWFHGRNPVLEESPLGKHACLRFERESNSKRFHLMLRQPLTNETKVLKTWEAGGPELHLNQTGTLLTETRYLPLAPFSLLGTNGLPDVLQCNFAQVLSTEQHLLGLNFFVLIRLYELPSCRLLTEFTSPSRLGQLWFVLPRNDERGLVIVPIGMPQVLYEYLQKYIPANTAELQELRNASFGCRVLDARTGSIELLPSGDHLPLRILSQTEDAVFYTQELDANDWPSSQLVSNRPIYHWMLVGDKLRKVEIPTTNGGFCPVRRFHSKELRFIIDMNRNEESNVTIVDWIDVDLDGKRVREGNFVAKNLEAVAALAGIDQFILFGKSNWPWQERINQWLERWPWLYLFPLAQGRSIEIYDAPSGQIVLGYHSRLPTYYDHRRSEDGKKLLILQGRSGGVITRLQVFDLPIPPRTTLQLWLPGGAGALAGVVMGYLIWRLLRKQAS